MTTIPKKKYTVEEYLQMDYKGEIFTIREIEGDSPEAMAGAKH